MSALLHPDRCTRTSGYFPLGHKAPVDRLYAGPTLRIQGYISTAERQLTQRTRDEYSPAAVAFHVSVACCNIPGCWTAKTTDRYDIDGKINLHLPLSRRRGRPHSNGGVMIFSHFSSVASLMTAFYWQCLWMGVHFLAMHPRIYFRRSVDDIALWSRLYRLCVRHTHHAVAYRQMFYY